MQLTMNMATPRFKSTSGSVSVALVVVVLVTVMVAETSAQPLSLAVFNELETLLVVSQVANAFEPSTATAIPPEREERVPVTAQDSTLYLRVADCVFVVPNSPEGREGSITGLGVLYVTGHCSNGSPGVQFVATIEGAAAHIGCAQPVDAGCRGPFS